VRLEIDPREVENDVLFVGRRDHLPKQKRSVPRGEFVASIGATLQAIHDSLQARDKDFCEQHTRRIDSEEEFYAWFTPPRVDDDMPTAMHGGFALTHFSGDVRVEDRIKNELGATVRCIPLEDSESGTCPFTGQPSAKRVVWAEDY